MYEILLYWIDFIWISEGFGTILAPKGPHDGACVTPEYFSGTRVAYFLARLRVNVYQSTFCVMAIFQVEIG